MFFDALIGVDLEAAMAADGERDNMANHSLGSAGLCVPSGLGLVLAGPASDGPMEDGIAAHVVTHRAFGFDVHHISPAALVWTPVVRTLVGGDDCAPVTALSNRYPD